MPKIDNSLRDNTFQRIVERLDAIEKRGGDMSGGNNDGTNSWQTSVENRLGQLHNDIVNLGNRMTDRMDRQFYITWAGMFAIAGILAKGFGWL